jgi:hypothetical protein
LQWKDRLRLPGDIIIALRIAKTMFPVAGRNRHRRAKHKRNA